MSQDFDDLDTPGLSLKDIVDVFARRRAVFLQVFAAVLTVGIVLSAMGKPSYRATARLVAPTSTYSININNADPFANIFSAVQGDSIDTQLQSIRSPEFQNEAMKQAGIILKPEVVPPLISADSGGGDGIIQVNVDGTDPHTIATLANKVIDLHIQKTKKHNQAGIDRANTFVGEELDKYTLRLNVAQKALETFNARHRMEELKQGQDNRIRNEEALGERVQSLDASNAASDGERVQVEAALRAQPPEVEEEHTVPNPSWEVLGQQLTDLEAQRTKLLGEYAPGSDKVQDLADRIAACQGELNTLPNTVLVKKLVDNVRRKVMQDQLAQVEDAIQRSRSERSVVFSQLQQVKKDIADAAESNKSLDNLQAGLMATRDQAQAKVKSFSDRLQDLELRKISQPEQVRVLERALAPTVPVDTNRASQIFAAFVAALVLAAIAVGLQEAIDDRITKPEDVNKLSPLPILAHVPYIGDHSSPLLTSLPANSPAGESYRALRFSIRLALVDRPIHRLLVTSPSEGEGKSVTAVNLATVMALEGWRVILVDADLRKPTLHRLLQLSNDTGVSELLAGMASPEEAIQETQIPNLRVICSGPVPPNPSELLGGEAFSRLLESLGEDADVLILDSPPCLPVTDPLVMCKEVEGIVLVLHAGQTRKAALRHALSQLERAGARVLGLVMNKVNQRGGAYYYYYGRYGYYGPGSESNGTNGTAPHPRRVWVPRDPRVPRD